MTCTAPSYFDTYLNAPRINAKNGGCHSGHGAKIDK
jgi:hypothetical protein